MVKKIFAQTYLWILLLLLYSPIVIIVIYFRGTYVPVRIAQSDVITVQQGKSGENYILRFSQQVHITL